MLFCDYEAQKNCFSSHHEPRRARMQQQGEYPMRSGWMARSRPLVRAKLPTARAKSCRHYRVSLASMWTGLPSGCESWFGVGRSALSLRLLRDFPCLRELVIFRPGHKNTCEDPPWPV